MEYLNKGAYEEVVNLFADESEVHFNDAVFVGKHRGVRNLYVERFGQRCSDMNDAPVHRLLLDPAPPQHLVEVATDRRYATARFHCIAQAEASLSSNLPLVQMARQQGQGILQWWERGVFENTYVKEGPAWKIRQLRYGATPGRYRTLHEARAA